MKRQFATFFSIMALLALTEAAHASWKRWHHASIHARFANHGRSYGHGGHNASVFCDRVTASGGMNCAAAQFAHRSWPLGSHHTLCGPRSCVNAMVVDRGPAAWTGRSFDLSPGLARMLGISGLGHVTAR